jgi:hypothetical protein
MVLTIFIELQKNRSLAKSRVPLAVPLLSN